jgi:hypothetical protein
MPIPTRKAGEERDEFISRCIGEMKVMEQEMTDEQIGAVCYSRLHKSFTEE